MGLAAAADRVLAGVYFVGSASSADRFLAGVD